MLFRAETVFFWSAWVVGSFMVVSLEGSSDYLGDGSRALLAGIRMWVVDEGTNREILLLARTD